ncbi:hypothetical protein COOONC_14698 [Cooperia oncophora]
MSFHLHNVLVKAIVATIEYIFRRITYLQPDWKGGRKTSTVVKPEDNSALSRQRQIYVPELMDRHPISATLWNLISALPYSFLTGVVGFAFVNFRSGREEGWRDQPPLAGRRAASKDVN